MSVRDKLERILERLEGRVGDERVFLRVYQDAARAAADAADARLKGGVALSPLDGAIVSIKDLFDVAGETTTAGSRLLRGSPPATSDAPVVARLREAGAVIIGKTNMVEFAFSGVGLNPHYGTPGNALDPQRVPGGSSSGAGVSVAEGTSDISIGSDTGGSVRIPAAFNGIVGFKPTAGRVPMTGVVPLSYTLDSIGPLARTVEDCAAADAVMAGEEPRRTTPAPLSGLRIGVPKGRLFSETEPVVAKSFETALKLVADRGAKIVDHDIEDLLEGMTEATRLASIASIEAAEIHAEWLEARASEYDPRVHWRIAASAAVPAPAYIRMIRRRNALAAAMDERLRPIDVLALPTIAIAAPPMQPLIESDELYTRTNLLILRNTMVANQFDLTSISLPIPGDALAGALMLVARHGEDRRLLEIAAGVERAFASASRR
jgi:aspartyl-tRNA(Asn)/glutamyl-tRNA(Gln) amidotransferase subunit A